MTNPFQRVVLALSYIKGPHVNNWLAQQMNEAATKVYNNIDPETDERIWQEWEQVFDLMFMDTASVEQAYTELTKLEMKNDKIDEYITAFERLRIRARWEQDAYGTLEMFKKGLP